MRLKSSVFIFLGLLVLSIQGFAQFTSKEARTNNIWFIKFAGSDLDDKVILEKINPDSVTKELKANLIQFRDDYKKVQDHCEMYATQLEPNNLFNINLYDPETGKQFGDVRFLYADYNDLIIDGWKYLPEYERPKPTKKDSLELEKVLKSIPPPPPPP